MYLFLNLSQKSPLLPHTHTHEHAFENLANNSVALFHEVPKIYDLNVEVHIIHYLTMWPF
jgi:hypothetical protein